MPGIYITSSFIYSLPDFDDEKLYTGFIISNNGQEIENFHSCSMPFVSQMAEAMGVALDLYSVRKQYTAPRKNIEFSNH